MSAANVVVYLAILGFLVYRRVQGRPAGSLKQLFVLPVVLCVLGYQDLAHKPLDTVDIAFAVAGGALSLLLGALRGSLNNITTRNGVPWVRWGSASVIVFALNIAAKGVLDVTSVAAGGTTSGATSSLLLAAGLMLVGEAAVIWMRLQTSPLRAGPAQRSQMQGVRSPHPSGLSVRDDAARLAQGVLRRLAERRIGG